jgi:8-hydroxy-5-deazaflavin:NADPH oxidoreductase
VKVGIIGGTGPAGRALAARLAISGPEVIIGSRAADRAEEAATELREAWPTLALNLRGGENAEASDADIVIVATPWEGAVQTIIDLKDALDGKVVVSMVNALTRFGREFQALVPVRGSIAATMQAAVPGARITTAFQHVPAGPLADLEHPIECDVLICADDADAAQQTAALVEVVPGFRAVRAGSLASANAVEALTAVLVNVNIRYKAHVALRLLGLPEPGQS